MKQDEIEHGSSYLLTVTEESIGIRIDTFLSNYFQQYSRSFLKKLFDKNCIRVNESRKIKPGYSLKLGDQVSIIFPKEEADLPQRVNAEEVKINIIAKEKDFLIIEKPAGLIVHPPEKSCQEAALTDWIVQTHDDIAHVGMIDRPGIVHRLDKNTSGIMIIPRTNQAHTVLSDMFKNRQIHKTYLAIVHGHPAPEGTIDFYIDRHHVIRNKMHHFTALNRRSSGRDAVTHYKVLEYYKEEYALVELKPITGRTHQIRVHLSAIGHPVFADSLYGTKSKLMDRHALHAHKLEFEYLGVPYEFTSKLDPELQNIIDGFEIIKDDNEN